eukprot:PITA_25624
MVSGGDIEMGRQSTLNPMSDVGKTETHSQLPPGFRFHPTDEELITYYLTKKNLDSSFSGSAIAEADLNKCEPWDLPGKTKAGEKEWYFFGHRERKYPRGIRTNRATDAGYWKTTGKDRVVFSARLSAHVGIKKTLVFYKGRAPKGQKTSWVMHEYRLESKFSCRSLPKGCNDEWVVCRVFKKSAVRKKSFRGLAFLDLPGSPSLPSLLKSPCNTTTENVQEIRSSESESGTSAKVNDDVSCFSIAMQPETDLTGHRLDQFQCGSSSYFPDSTDRLSGMASLMKQPSYIHNLLLNDPMIYSKMIPEAPIISASIVKRDQKSAILEQQPASQLPGLPPSILCNSHVPPPSTSSNLGLSTDAYFSAFLSSHGLFNPIVDQSRNPMEQFSSSRVDHKTLSDNNFQRASDSLSQKISAQPIQEADSATFFSTFINDELTSLVCNRLDQPHYQLELDSSAARPGDFDSLWNIGERIF